VDVRACANEGCLNSGVGGKDYDNTEEQNEYHNYN
jgi:hypothetical protein